MTKDFNVENNQLVSTGSDPQPLSAETAIYECDISLYSDIDTLNSIKQLEVNVTVDGYNVRKFYNFFPFFLISS